MGNSEANRRLLIVDDDHALGQMLSWCFDDLGYDVTLAYDGFHARRLANRQAFEFALLDFQLPDCDGVELRQQLCDQQPSLRTAMMSANPPMPERHEISKFHVKPVSISKLDRWFQNLLSTPESGTEQHQ